MPVFKFHLYKVYAKNVGAFRLGAVKCRAAKQLSALIRVGKSYGGAIKGLRRFSFIRYTPKAFAPARPACEGLPSRLLRPAGRSLNESRADTPRAVFFQPVLFFSPR